MPVALVGRVDIIAVIDAPVVVVGHAALQVEVLVYPMPNIGCVTDKPDLIRHTLLTDGVVDDIKVMLVVKLLRLIIDPHLEMRHGLEPRRLVAPAGGDTLEIELASRLEVVDRVLGRVEGCLVAEENHLLGELRDYGRLRRGHRLSREEDGVRVHEGMAQQGRGRGKRLPRGAPREVENIAHTLRHLELREQRCERRVDMDVSCHAWSISLQSLPCYP